MKKIVFLLSLIVLAASCDWFEFDNQECYNAQVEGCFVDSLTGEPVQFAFPNSCTFEVYEEGWDAEASQKWYLKPNGYYKNTLTFAGKYRLQTVNQNFYPVIQHFELKEGANEIDFIVTPYARVIDPEIFFDGKKIIARFKVEVSDSTRTDNVDIALFGFTDRWVSDGNNNFTDQKTSRQSNVTADGTTFYELSVDPSITSGLQFIYKRDHYLRIGAVATGNGVNTNKRYNFSPVFKVSPDFTVVHEVIDWDE